ncbi:MAG TPA: ATP-dependent zinc metalloprotease FtsH [Nocardioidaceae bacterium]|nr:ATP-dependent zinc metalloprotease FtsH [Nocardioidaceae bacterium]
MSTTPAKEPERSRPPWRVEGAPKHAADDGGRRRTPWWHWLLLLLILLPLNWAISNAVLGPEAPTDVSYSFFRAQVEAGNVAEVTAVEDELTGTLEREVAYPPKAEEQTRVEVFRTYRPTFADDSVIEDLIDQGVSVSAEPYTGAPWWQQLLIGFGPTLLFIGLLVWFLGRSARAGLGGGLGGLGKSRAEMYHPESGRRTTFDDVAGIDEVEAEVMEIVDFLKNPERYRKLGAFIPKGVLLTGAPGTGKTLLARAVAGEANVPFFHISASEFIEMIVGVGASRVRDLFDQGKKAAPSIIFIDELDAIGRARGAGVTFGGHDEREQTLNQILTEMDGFTGTEGVVVLAATNRPEILDPALLRAGRFDRKIHINPPDKDGRAQILGVHTRGVPLADDVALSDVAAATPGMVGADLKNLVNEAALLAAKNRHERVTADDFTDALEKIVLGTARRILISPEERRRTAFHESGHALLGMITPGADRVRKVSIIPRGASLGATYQAPEDDKHYFTRAYVRGRIVGALGGRAAEELVYADATTGAESDLQMVTALARQMVGRWGMSEAVGPVAVLPAPGEEQTFFDVNGPSPSTRDLVDAEVRRIVDECYAEALDTLRAHRPNLDRLAARLLEAETLDEHEAYLAAELSGELVPMALTPTDIEPRSRGGRSPAAG